MQYLDTSFVCITGF